MSNARHRWFITRVIRTCLCARKYEFTNLLLRVSAKNFKPEKFDK